MLRAWTPICIGIVITAVGCTTEDGIEPIDDGTPELPEGWSEESHSDSADPDYDVVFADGVVQRLDITLAAGDYEAMLTDVDEIVGEGGGPGDPPDGPPPTEALTACEGLQEMDPCEYDYDGEHVEGVCLPDPMQGMLWCIDLGELPDVAGQDPIYVPVTLSHDGRDWPYVGMRFKGNSSLTYSWQEGVLKLPLRLEMDEYEDTHPETDDQRFWGFKELTLAPGYMDDSYLHDTLANEIYDALGIPVARTAFYEVYVDVGEGPHYWGLYTLIEDPSDAMMDRVYGDGSGNLYKPEMGCSDWTCFDQASFAKKNNEDEADYSDVEAAVAALLDDGGDAEEWREAMEQAFDVPGFLRWLAASNVIVSWDCYGMIAHNYYLYGDPGDGGRLTWVPWDHNMSLEFYPMGNLTLSMDEVDDSWPLLRKLMDDPVYSAAYYVEVEKTLEGPLELDTFTARAQELHDLIAPYIEAEEAPFTQLSSLSAFEDSVTDLVQHVEERRAEVEALLEAR